MTGRDVPLTVLQLSDLHIFASDQTELLGLNTNASLCQVLDAISSIFPQPDVVLLTGDIAQDESAEAYQTVTQIFRHFSIPIYALPGNHDDSGLIGSILSQPPFQPDRVFIHQGWQFILLDSSVRSQVKGELSSQALSQLDQTLHNCSRPTVIALHHPAYQIQSAWLDDGLTNYQDFWAILDQHDQVKVVLNGHIHQAMTFARKGVQYLGAPSTCVQFKPRSETFAVDTINPGFRLLSLFPNGSYQSWVERVPITQQVNLQSQGY